MANPTLDDLTKRALDALREQHARMTNELARNYAELAQAIEHTRIAMSELEPSTLDLLEKAHAVWIGDVTIPRDAVRAGCVLRLDGGNIELAIGPSIWHSTSREMLPELSPGKFRVVCFAIRTGDATGDFPEPRHRNV